MPYHSRLLLYQMKQVRGWRSYDLFVYKGVLEYQRFLVSDNANATDPQPGGSLSFTFAFTSRIPSEAYPSFRTFTITNSHSLKMTLEATVCGHKFELSDEIRVLLHSPLDQPPKGILNQDG